MTMFGFVVSQDQVFSYFNRVAKHVFGVSGQQQNMVKGLKFRKNDVEGLHYLCRKNQGPD